MIKGLKEILDQFHIKPNDISLYEKAFTHASYTNEHPECESYDRLEFLGDSILDLVVAEIVFEHYPKEKSGMLSKMRAYLVEGKMLTTFSENRFGFDKLVRYSIGEKTNGHFHKRIHEDIFEAFIGACYLDQGFNFVKKLLEEIYNPYLDDLKIRANLMDSKTRLQESLNVNIDYVQIKATNINKENVCYVVEARVGDVVLGVGQGHNLKEAQTNAANDALSKKVGT